MGFSQPITTYSFSTSEGQAVLVCIIFIIVYLQLSNILVNTNKWYSCVQFCLYWGQFLDPFLVQTLLWNTIYYFSLSSHNLLLTSTFRRYYDMCVCTPPLLYTYKDLWKSMVFSFLLHFWIQDRNYILVGIYKRDTNKSNAMRLVIFFLLIKHGKSSLFSSHRNQLSIIVMPQKFLE